MWIVSFVSVRPREEEKRMAWPRRERIVET